MWMDNFGKKMGFSKWNDWYRVKQSDFDEHGGRSILMHYFAASPVQAVTSTYGHDFDWQIWRFDRVPTNYWSDDIETRKFLEWAKVELEIREDDDWYRVSNFHSIMIQ